MTSISRITQAAFASELAGNIDGLFLLNQERGALYEFFAAGVLSRRRESPAAKNSL